MTGLSDYEKKRLENIKENEALLKELNVPSVNKRTTQTAKVLRTHAPPKKKVKKEPPQPQRQSARLRGVQPSEEDLRPMPVNDHFITAGRSSRVTMDGTVDKLDQSEQGKLLASLKTALDVPNSTPTVYIKEEDRATGELGDKELLKQASKLEIRHEWKTVKLTPYRTSACLFHPSNTKLLGCAADIEGNFSIWDIENAHEDGEPVVFNYKPHTKGITDLKFNPTDASKLLTSSYDGNIRIYDMNKTEFETVEMGSEGYPITSFDLTADGNTLWFSSADGEVGLLDIRAGKEPNVIQLRDKKIGCVHQNPVHSHLLAVASNDRTCTIWDNRMWGKNVDEMEPLHTFQHGYSVTSAYWSPRGDLLATVSYDDLVRVFEMKKEGDIQLKAAVKHNNHTGRWVTNFRARWNTNPNHAQQHFVIGNMDKTVDIFNGETGNEIVRLFDKDHITAIPSVSQFHPTMSKMTLLGCNATGRAVCWQSS